MSEVSGCRWYNPCSWFSSCCGDDKTGEREPLNGSSKTSHDPKTPETERRGVSTPGNTPTKSPGVKAERMVTGQQWE